MGFQCCSPAWTFTVLFHLLQVVKMLKTWKTLISGKTQVRSFRMTWNLSRAAADNNNNVCSALHIHYSLFYSLLHSTCGLKEAFEMVSVEPSGTSLQLYQQDGPALYALQRQSLTGIPKFLEAQGHKRLRLSARELSQLKELVEVLAPFIQGDLIQLSNLVQRFYLSLTHLPDTSLGCQMQSIHLVCFVIALQKSLLTGARCPRASSSQTGGEGDDNQ